MFKTLTFLRRPYFMWKQIAPVNVQKNLTAHKQDQNKQQNCVN